MRAAVAKPGQRQNNGSENMTIKDFDKEKMELLTLFSMAQTLKNTADKATFRQARGIYNQYKALRDRLISIDPEASNLLPGIRVGATIHLDGLLGDTRVAINQMVAYLNTKMLPTGIEFMGSIISWMKEQGITPIGGPLTKLSPILGALGLSPRWTVAASALCLLEVIVNRKLNGLGMSTEGSFEKRVKRLSSKGKEKGVELPDLLAPAFYKVRHKVAHGGKEPTQDELNTIIRFLEKLFQKTSRLTT